MREHSFWGKILPMLIAAGIIALVGMTWDNSRSIQALANQQAINTKAIQDIGKSLHYFGY